VNRLIIRSLLNYKKSFCLKSILHKLKFIYFAVIPIKISKKILPINTGNNRQDILCIFNVKKLYELEN